MSGKAGEPVVVHAGGRSPDEALIREFATDLYEKAPHSKHRESAAALMRRLEHPDESLEQHATLLVSDTPHGQQVTGGALSETYSGSIARLTCIIVRADQRGKGHGSVLMREILDRHRGMTLMAEMADPGHATAGYREDALRIAEMFRRWGWRALGCAYHQPTLDPDKGRASDLLLLHHGPLLTLQKHRFDDFNASLRQSLGAEEPHPGRPHRWPPASLYADTGLIPTFEIPAFEIPAASAARHA